MTDLKDSPAKCPTPGMCLGHCDRCNAVCLSEAPPTINRVINDAVALPESNSKVGDSPAKCPRCGHSEHDDICTARINNDGDVFCWCGVGKFIPAAALPDSREMPGQPNAKQMWKDWRPSRYNGYDLIGAGMTLELADRMDAEVVEFAEAYAKLILAASAPSGNAGSQPADSIDRDDDTKQVLDVMAREGMVSSEPADSGKPTARKWWVIDERSTELEREWLTQSEHLAYVNWLEAELLKERAK